MASVVPEADLWGCSLRVSLAPKADRPANATSLKTTLLGRQARPDCIPAQCRLPDGHVDAIQPGSIFAQDLALSIERQIHMVFLLKVVRQFECHELLDQPSR